MSSVSFVLILRRYMEFENAATLPLRHMVGRRRAGAVPRRRRHAQQMLHEEIESLVVSIGVLDGLSKELNAARAAYRTAVERDVPAFNRGASGLGLRPLSIPK